MTHLTGEQKIQLYNQLTQDNKESILISLGVPAGTASTVASRGSADFFATVDQYNGWTQSKLLHSAASNLLGFPSQTRSGNRLGTSTPSQRGALVDLVAPNWQAFSGHLNVAPSKIEAQVHAGASPFELATKLVQMLYNENRSIDDIAAACVLAGWHVNHVNRIFNGAAAPVGISSATAPRGSSILDQLDEEEQPKTMREIVNAPGNKTTATMVTALSRPSQPWKALLDADQSDAKVAAVFAHLREELGKSENPAFDLLARLVETKRFGNMTPTTFVETLFVPVAELKAVARKIIADYDDASDKQRAALKSKTAALINWRETIARLNLGLRKGFTTANVIDALEELGVANEEHLKHVKASEFVECGFNMISARTLVQEFGKTPAVMDEDEE